MDTVLLLPNKLSTEACNTIISGVSYKISLLISISLTYLLLTWHQINAIILSNPNACDCTPNTLGSAYQEYRNQSTPQRGTYIALRCSFHYVTVLKSDGFLRGKFISAPLLSSSCFREISQGYYLNGTMFQRTTWVCRDMHQDVF